ncbi:hypothetical protein D3C73_1241760 [compost metagenome]
MTGIEDRDPLLAGGLEKEGRVGHHRVEVFEDEAVLLLHVDDQQCVFIVHGANLIMAGRGSVPKHNAAQA